MGLFKTKKVSNSQTTNQAFDQRKYTSIDARDQSRTDIDASQRYDIDASQRYDIDASQRYDISADQDFDNSINDAFNQNYDISANDNSDRSTTIDARDNSDRSTRLDVREETDNSIDSAFNNDLGAGAIQTQGNVNVTDGGAVAAAVDLSKYALQSNTAQQAEQNKLLDRVFENNLNFAKTTSVEAIQTAQKAATAGVVDLMGQLGKYAALAFGAYVLTSGFRK